MANDTLRFPEELELDIVALSLNDLTFFLTVSEYLLPKHFVNENLGKVYGIIKDFFDEQHLLPTLGTVKHEANKLRVEVPHDNVFIKDTKTRDYLMTEVTKLVRHQELKKFVIRSAEMLDDHKEPDFGKLEEELRKVVNIQPTLNLGMDYWDEARFARMLRTQTEKIPTGIPSIDLTSGGLGRKELTCIAAGPGTGKSWLLVMAGSYMLRAGYNVMHYTLEMSEEVTALRYDVATFNWTTSEIFNKMDQLKEKVRKHASVLDKSLYIKEFPTKGANVATFRSHLQKLHEQKGFVPDVVIADYGDIMRANKHYTSRYDEQGAIFQELRALGQEKDIAILSATQTNRGALSKDIATMEDLGDSFDKARIMDNLYMILQKPEEKEDNLLRIYDAKVRNAQAGKIRGYEIDYERATLRLIEKDTDEDE